MSPSRSAVCGVSWAIAVLQPVTVGLWERELLCYLSGEAVLQAVLRQWASACIQKSCRPFDHGAVRQNLIHYQTFSFWEAGLSNSLHVLTAEQQPSGHESLFSLYRRTRTGETRKSGHLRSHGRV